MVKYHIPLIGNFRLELIHEKRTLHLFDIYTIQMSKMIWNSRSLTIGKNCAYFSIPTYFPIGSGMVGRSHELKWVHASWGSKYEYFPRFFCSSDLVPTGKELAKKESLEPIKMLDILSVPRSNGSFVRLFVRRFILWWEDASTRLQLLGGLFFLTTFFLPFVPFFPFCFLFLLLQNYPSSHSASSFPGIEPIKD